MDQVLFLIKGHEVYIGEHYKNKIKKVVFKEKDFWEVFDQHDFREMIDYMNYPMNYKKFRDNKIYILYDSPTKYEMLCQVQSVFEQSEGVAVGQLMPYLVKAYQRKCQVDQESEMREYIVYEQTYYKIQRSIDEEQEILTLSQQNEWEIEGVTEIVEEAERMEQLQKCVCTITTEDICSVVFEDQSEIIDLQSYYPILAPVNLYKNKQEQTKRRFLETYFVLDEVSLKKSEDYVQKEAILFSYNKVVSKLFGKKQEQILYKKVPKEGIYYHCLEESGEVWATKGQLIGIISEDIDREKVIHWLEKSGFGGTISE